MFGTIVDEKMILNEFGELTKNEWLMTSKVRLNVDIDKFAIMPNHLHGILLLRDLDDVGAHCNVPLPDTPQTEQFGKSTVNSNPYNNQII